MTFDSNGQRLLLLTSLMVLIIPAYASSATSAKSTGVSDWTVHDSIRINGDDNFTSANGVVSGSGTKSDPYIIEGWQIGPHEGFLGIDVRNTVAYFRIRDVFVFSCSIAVLLNNVTHARIESSRFTANSIGVAAYHCDSCSVWNCTFDGNNIGISISYSDISRSDNTYVNNGRNVFRLKDDTPWEQTWVGVAVCVAVLIPLAIVSIIMLYYRARFRGPKEPEK